MKKDKLKLKVSFILMIFSLIGFIVTINKNNISLEMMSYCYQEKLNNTYSGKTVYYNQEDPKWADIPYNTYDSTIGTSGCGVTAMAMILATMKDKNINPIELANFSMENGYCEGYTTRQFFTDIVNKEEYSLNLTRLYGYETENLKNLLSDGKHMAIAIMKPGHFTKEGHYVVVYGFEEINGQDYFKVMDPHKDNDNYGNDGQVIYNDLKNGRVKASELLFQNESDEYWIYSKDDKM